MEQRRLERAGYGVITAAGPAEAMRQLARHRFALILLDYRLPDGDGLTVLKQIKEGDPDTLAWIPTERLPANRSRGIRPFLGVHSRMGISDSLYLITVQPPPVRVANVRTGRSPVACGRYWSALSTSSSRRGLYAEKPHDIVAARLSVHVRS